MFLKKGVEKMHSRVYFHSINILLGLVLANVLSRPEGLLSWESPNNQPQVAAAYF